MGGPRCFRPTVNRCCFSGHRRSSELPSSGGTPITICPTARRRRASPGTTTASVRAIGDRHHARLAQSAANPKIVVPVGASRGWRMVLRRCPAASAVHVAARAEGADFPGITRRSWFSRSRPASDRRSSKRERMRGTSRPVISCTPSAEHCSPYRSTSRTLAVTGAAVPIVEGVARANCHHQRRGCTMRFPTPARWCTCQARLRRRGRK